MTIESVDFKTGHEMTLETEIFYDGGLDLVKAGVRRFGRGGTDSYDLVLRPSVPPGPGLGSSSTMMVGTDGSACRALRGADG
jgi:D-glycero-alpha-D-manno-heptose-7-phosphate kinase